MKLVYRSVVVLLMVLGVACIEAPSDGEPGSLQDMGSEVDIGNGSTDSGEVDAGEVDAGEVDAGEVDAGEVDAGEVDAGEMDAGVECTSSDDCSGLADVCNEQGVCVECTETEPCGERQECVREACFGICSIASEDTDCADGQRCGSNGVCEYRDDTDGEARTCGFCEGDVDCQAGARCIELDNMKVCLSAKPGNACPAPYGTEVTGVSVGWGHEATYCAPTTGVTCQYLRDFGRACPVGNPDFCSSGLQKCVLTVTTDLRRCSYDCDDDDQCEMGSECRSREIAGVTETQCLNEEF